MGKARRCKFQFGLKVPGYEKGYFYLVKESRIANPVLLTGIHSLLDARHDRIETGYKKRLIRTCLLLINTLQLNLLAILLLVSTYCRQEIVITGVLRMSTPKAPENSREGLKLQAPTVSYEKMLKRLKKIQDHLSRPRTNRMKDKVCILTGVGSLKGIGCAFFLFHVA